MRGEKRITGSTRNTGNRHLTGKAMLLFLTMAGCSAAFAAALSKKRPGRGSGKVEYTDDDPGGLSLIMGNSLAMFMQEESRKMVADKMNVSIAIQDITAPEVATTLTFQGSDVSVSDGVAPAADIYIGTDMNTLLSMSCAGTGRRMVRWFGTDEGLKLINAFKEGRVMLRGAVFNAPQMMKFQALVAPM